MAGGGLVEVRKIVSAMVVADHRVAMAVSEPNIEWEFGPGLKGPVERDGSETVHLASGRIVTAVEKLLPLEDGAVMVAVQER